MIGSDNGEKQNTKPLISLKNFTGMGDNGMYWLDGFLPKSLQGKTILTQGWGAGSFINSSNAGFSSLSMITAMTSYKHIDDNQVASIASANIFDFSIYGASKLGLIHSIPASVPLYPCQGASILSTRKGNLIYSSSNNLGVGWVRKVTGGSTTTLVDTARDFTAIGISNTIGRNKVFNLTKGVEYTVTSVSGTGNNTLNFSATTAPSVGDWYIAFSDDRFYFGTTNDVDLQFTPQQAPQYWNRQIILWNDTYYILNGNYIASLSTDETSWTSDIIGTPPSTGNPGFGSDKNKKQLPNNHQSLMMEYNQDRLLVCSYIKGRGSLLLWDGYSPNWLSILEIDVPATGIIRYLNGWIVLVGYSLYFTDGYTLQYLDKLPDSIMTNTGTPHKYNMVSTEDGFLMSLGGNNLSRLNDGFYSYNIKDLSWSYFPNCDRNNKLNRTNGSLFVVNEYGTSFSNGKPTIFCSGGNNGNEIEIIRNKGAKKSNVLIYLKLPQKMNIGTIELNLSPRNDYNPSPNQTNKVMVNYGQGQNPMFTNISFGAGSAINVINSNGANNKSKIGQEILITNGNDSYQRTFIESVLSGGTLSEQLYLSPLLTDIPDSYTTIKKLDLYNSGSIIINSDSFPQEIQFTIPTFYSDKLWLEIVFENQDVYPLDIHEINIF